mmetsp:Transcript_7253/g.15108  ORF Transcript_7253/g.15108 Transcript_7253/m.15108 type:complete len:229 (+) Transcript_7253:140-826(+)
MPGKSGSLAAASGKPVIANGVMRIAKTKNVAADVGGRNEIAAVVETNKIVLTTMTLLPLGVKAVVLKTTTLLPKKNADAAKGESVAKNEKEKRKRNAGKSADVATVIVIPARMMIVAALGTMTAAVNGKREEMMLILQTTHDSWPSYKPKEKHWKNGNSVVLLELSRNVPLSLLLNLDTRPRKTHFTTPTFTKLLPGKRRKNKAINKPQKVPKRAMKRQQQRWKKLKS